MLKTFDANLYCSLKNGTQTEIPLNVFYIFLYVICDSQFNAIYDEQIYKNKISLRINE